MIEPKPENLLDIGQLVFLIGDDTEKLNRFLNLYYEEYAAKSTQIKLALEQKQFHLAQQHAHNITGSAQMLGANALLRASQAFDHALKKNTYDPLLGIQFNLILDQTLAALANTIKTH